MSASPDAGSSAALVIFFSVASSRTGGVVMAGSGGDAEIETVNNVRARRARLIFVFINLSHFPRASKTA
jgi:hypothetical protein